MMLSESTIRIVRLAAGVLLVVGLTMMVGWPITQWPVSGELAVTTIGAWLVGMAFHAWWLQRCKALAGALPCAVQLGGFGLGLLAIILIYFSKVKLDAGALLFIASLLSAACAGLIPIIESKRMPMQDDRRTMPMIVRVGIIGFVLIACYIGGKLILSKSNSYSDGGIFPERLNEMTARMFGVFYLSVALAAVSTALSRSSTHMCAFAICGLVVLSMILIAAALHWRLWDFSNRPREGIYIGVYGLIVVSTAIALWVTGRKTAV